MIILRIYFLSKAIPVIFQTKCIRRFLGNQFSPVPKVSLAPKKIIYFCLPFNGQHSLQICTQIRKLCSNAFSHISIRFDFRPLLRLAHFFSFKERIPNGLKSRVVYLFKCRCCNASYGGQTSRPLHTQIADHLSISAFTGKERVNPSATNILSHHHYTGHPTTSDDFTIFSHSYSSIPHELFIRESLLIHKLNPTLNSQSSSIPLSLF